MRPARSYGKFLLLFLSAPLAASRLSAREVDHRYAPVWWQTLIGLVDDPQKMLVGKDGELLYDFGGGPLRNFSLTVSADAEGGSTWVRQDLLSPRVPVVRTVRRQGNVVLTQEAFALPLSPGAVRKPSVSVRRVGEETRLEEFARPAGDVDPAFRRATVGWNQPIRFRFPAAKGGHYTIAFGVCEGYWTEPGHRILDLRVEGQSRRTVDVVAERGPNVPAVYFEDAADRNGDGWIDVTVASAPAATDRNTILNALWVLDPASHPSEEEMIHGAGRMKALGATAGAEATPTRYGILHLTFRNTGAQATIIQPVLTVRTSFPVAADGRNGVRVGPTTRIVASVPEFTLVRAGDRKLLRFHYVKLPPGASSDFTTCIVREGSTPAVIPNLRDAGALRDRAVRYWQTASLPYGVIQVPDPGIQALLDSSIRNIYQAREIKNGLPSFQVGPTVYRGLWVVDGAFLLDAVSTLGRTREARSGIEYLLGYQRSDGGFMLIGNYWKETGIVLWAVANHARMTGDRKWLRSEWPRVRKAVAYIERLRRETLADPNAPNAGLIPAGFSDGGLGGNYPEYTNVYWSLIGLKSAVEAARWLGETADARAWSKEYADFDATFRKAAARDSRDDGHGNRVLPIRMVDPDHVAPQRGQWGFLHAVYPGELFRKDDPIVRGNMAMLRSTEQEGMVVGSGWLADGIWNYLASFYGHAWLWLGDGRKAADVLYAFANHSAPVLDWREEQMPQGNGDAFVGDMPHNWASAEFIRLVRHLLVLERGRELHLFEGLPAEWVRPGAVTRLNGVVTAFGPVSFSLSAAKDGRTAKLVLDPPRREKPSRIVLHLDNWSGATGTRDLPVTGRTVRVIPLAIR